MEEQKTPRRGGGAAKKKDKPAAEQQLQPLRPCDHHHRRLLPPHCDHHLRRHDDNRSGRGQPLWVATMISPPVESGSGWISRVRGINEKRGMMGRGRPGGGEKRAPLDLTSAAGSARAAPGSEKSTGGGEEQAVTHAISNACCLPTAGIIPRVGGCPPLVSFVNVVTDRDSRDRQRESLHHPVFIERVFITQCSSRWPSACKKTQKETQKETQRETHRRRHALRSYRSSAPSIISLLMFAPAKPFEP